MPRGAADEPEHEPDEGRDGERDQGDAEDDGEQVRLVMAVVTPALAPGVPAIVHGRIVGRRPGQATARRGTLSERLAGGGVGRACALAAERHARGRGEEGVEDQQLDQRQRLRAMQVGADRELPEPLLAQVAREVHLLPDRLLDRCCAFVREAARDVQLGPAGCLGERDPVVVVEVRRRVADETAVGEGGSARERLRLRRRGRLRVDSGSYGRIQRRARSYSGSTTPGTRTLAARLMEPDWRYQ